MTFISCEDVLDCLINSKSPELPEVYFNNAIYGDYYYQELEAEIRNASNDDEYYYFFELEGQLPDGITMSVDHRTIIFEGVTQRAGSYHFKLFLEVEPNEYSGAYDDDMCTTSTSKEYTISVNYL